MINFIIRKFIKNSDDVEKQEVRMAYGILSSVIGILSNIVLFVVKFLIGILTNSISVTADAFNNLSDVASSVITFVGVKLANKPADKEHPFGHGRYEYIAALIVSFIIMQVGFTLFKTSIDKIKHPENLTFGLIPICILAASIIVKLWLAVLNMQLGKRINSTALKATGQDAFNDTLATTATIVSILIYQFTNINIDGYIGLVVAVMVLLAGIGIARDTLEPLIGQAIPYELYQNITNKIESYHGIYGTHDLIVHNYGPSKVMATIHVEVPTNMGMEQAHELIDQIEVDIFKEFGIFMVIHMDPIELDNEKVQYYKGIVENVILSVNNLVTIHDFRLVFGTDKVKLIFDAVVPYSYSDKDKEMFKEDVFKKVQEIDKKCSCDIHVETSYVAE